MIQRERLLDRFLRYVQIDTTAREDTDQYPSSPGQLELGRLISRELTEVGLADVRQDEHGIVLASVPSSLDRPGPVVVLNSHFDTSPETSGAGVKPQVIRDYRGGDIVLPADRSRIIRVAENPALAALLGHTIITSDGTTLLGADDKAGLAVIVETAATLLEQSQLTHGLVRLLFTCDEEIGHGVDHVDVPALGAAVCYTLDGQGANEIDVETFSADLAIVTIRGANIHPSIAKGRMTNAIRVAADFVERLPRDRLAPEVTSDRQGFLHPYHVEGGVAETRLRILLRDFDTENLQRWARLLHDAADDCRREFPTAQFEVDVRPQYRNMAAGLAREPRAVGLAHQALEQLGRRAELTVVRGGTDGSRFTELGLPTPNLSTGQHNPHSPLEWASLDEMEQACEMLVVLLGLWGREA